MTFNGPAMLPYVVWMIVRNHYYFGPRQEHGHHNSKLLGFTPSSLFVMFLFFSTLAEIIVNYAKR